MGITHTLREGIAEIVVNYPKVNAIPTSGWFELAGLLDDLSQDSNIRCVILAAEGRGFNAGVDIKEMQTASGHQALLAANRGCFAAFKAVYECSVPVIAAVHGHCVGGGIGLVGNADMIIASDDAFFALPEVDRGALGAATHLARMVPPHRLRAMVYTGAKATAEELHRWGCVQEVVSRDELLNTARKWAQGIAAKRPAVIRAAKECLNGIDPIDVNRSYRYEQGFTFELNLMGVGDEAREEFVQQATTDMAGMAE